MINRENEHQSLFFINCQNIFEILFSLFTANVKVITESYPPRCRGQILRSLGGECFKHVFSFKIFFNERSIYE